MFELDSDLETLTLEELRVRRQILETGKSHNEWEHLYSAYMVFILNWEELADQLYLPRKDVGLGLALDQSRFDPNSDIAREFNWAMHQRLMNYLASAKMLIDHTRRFMKPYADIEPEFEQENQRRVAAIAANDLAKFVQELRNYVLHMELPWHGMTITYTTGVLTEYPIILRFNMASMKNYLGWSRRAKDFMEANEKVAILEIMRTYTGLIKGLYVWLFGDSRNVNLTMKTAQRRNAVNSRIIDIERELGLEHS